MRRWIVFLFPWIALGELWIHAQERHRAPTQSEWKTAADIARGMIRPTDLVVISPSWADPLMRHELGDAQMTLEKSARPDLSRYQEAVEISLFHEHADELKQWKEIDRTEQGKFQYRRLKNPDYQPIVFDFTANLRLAKVSQPQMGLECVWNSNAMVFSGGLGGHPTFPQERFECSDNPFMSVGMTVIADEQFRPRRCMWAHPPRVGSVKLRYENVSLGNKMIGHHGLYWMVERERKGAEIQIDMFVEGKIVGRQTHRDGDGWSSFEINLGEFSNRTVQSVEFDVSTSNYLHRHYCFDMTSVQETVQ